jgi:hypothetical protein
VQELRDVIAGIPDDHIELSSIFQNGSRWNLPKPCGAIACVAGWAWLYPPFVEAGIRNATLDGTTMDNCAAFFQVHVNTFEGADYNERGSDKQIALRRLDRLLE